MIIIQSILLQLEPWPEWDSPPESTHEGLSPGLTTISPGLLHGCGQNQLDLLAWQGWGWRGLAHRPSVARSRHPEASAWGLQATRPDTGPGPCMASHSAPVAVASIWDCTLSGFRAPVTGQRAVVPRSSWEAPASRHPPPLACPLFPITLPPPTPPDSWCLGLCSSAALVASVKSL